MRLADVTMQIEVLNEFAGAWELDGGQLRNFRGEAIGSFPWGLAFADVDDWRNAALASFAPELLAELVILSKRVERRGDPRMAKEARELIARIDAAVEAAKGPGHE